MHLRRDATTISHPKSTSGWRVAVDRAWRSDSMRQRFETECGLSPVDETVAAQMDSGEVAAYYEEFVVWATRTLGLEDQVPAFMQRVMTARR